VTAEGDKAIRGTYEACFKTDAGRVVLAHLCALFHLRRSTMQEQPNGTAFQEGQRSVVLFILDQMDPMPEQADSEEHFAYLRELYGENF
jgi:hypothetical protein